MASDAERDYWQAVAQKVGERCDFYSAEDLAAFAEGNLRGRNAQALQAHVSDCAHCRRVLEELRGELAPDPVAVRVRFAPARGWAWALAASAVAAALIAVLVLRPGPTGVQPPQGGSARPSATVAVVPPEARERPLPPRPPEALPSMTVTPQRTAPQAAPGRRRAGVKRQGAHRSAVVEAPEERVASGAGIVNSLPAAATLAFTEPTPTATQTPAEVAELLRQGAVNDLPDDAAQPLDEASVGEFYAGFDELVEDLKATDEGAAQ